MGAEPRRGRAATADTWHGRVAYTSYDAEPGAVPIVLVPGFQSDQVGWQDRGYQDLLDEYQVITVDPIGHGLSSKPREESAYDTTSVVNEVMAVLDAESIDRAVIWGFSRGGFIAGLCAELVADRCLAVVLGAAPVGAAVELTAPALRAGEPFLAAADWDAYWASYPLPLPEALKARFQATNDPVALAAACRAMDRWPVEVPGFGLNSVDVPRFAYFGSGEVFADALRNEFDVAAVEYHEGGWPGHAETMMDPQGVVAAVRPFLQRLTDG